MPSEALPERAVEIRIRGGKMNPMGSALMADLLEQIHAADGAPLLLTGEGRAFSAGLDLKEVLGLDIDGMRVFLNTLVELARTLHRHPAPTVAAVHGHAIAGGAVLARCCDVVVASEAGKGRIGLNEVALGLRFPPKLIGTLMSKIPLQHRTEVFLGAALHRGPQALRLGLVDRLAPGDTEAAVRGAAIDALAAYSAHPADAYAAAKAVLQQDVREPSQAELDHFETHGLPVWAGPDIKARIRAILGL